MTTDSRDPGSPGDDDMHDMETGPSDSQEPEAEAQDFIDIETLGDEADFGETGAVSELAADGGDDSDDFDFQDDDKRSSRSGFKKMLAPVLVLVIASGIGAYIVMNPGVLGNGKPPVSVPVTEGESAALPPGSGPATDTASTQGTPGLNAPPANETEAASLDVNMPQPATNINEPGLPAAQGQASQDQTEEKSSIAELNDVSGPVGQEGASDITEPVSQGPVPVLKEPPPMPSAGEVEEVRAVDITEPAAPPEAVPAPPPLEDVSGSQEAGQEPAGAAAENMPAAEPLSAPVKNAAAEKSLDVSPSAAVSAEESPKRKAPADHAQYDVPTPPSGQQQDNQEQYPQVGAGMPVQKNGQAAVDGAYIPPVAGDANDPAKIPPPGLGPPGPDVYYDSSMQVPSGPLSDAVGPRKINPVQEPASKWVIVEQEASADSMEAQIVSANRALKLGRHDSAREMFEALYAKNNRDPRILMGRAVAMQNSGMPESAIRAYDELLDIDHDNADALVNMLGLLRHQYPEVALRRLLDLHTEYPGNPAIAAQIGITESDLGHTDDALRFLGIAASLEPNNAQHFFNMAVTCDRAGKRTQAIQYYQQALETDAAYGGSRSIPRDQVYDRLAALRRR